mmetsp:Transcript_5063/g.13037  ORF Transcript_5063/g.13037 Transcript_5063/m.13037 type:complete len:103 (+) Transcript_5063:91-399(+)|eukprot:CAMPEP_0184719758 /NCGR_PEP_ID=MMETSP0314-20130426/9432_1 /TAXON_ID=38298 /ORGANISM="Rhodella maculata, Strain CCMP 736" /LENGTH=102 /DNA_ID=CAMNT_0027183687 /DNA_START=13 /DNA_END=321 /DNA_ORIENTATION=-
MPPTLSTSAPGADAATTPGALTLASSSKNALSSVSRADLSSDHLFGGLFGILFLVAVIWALIQVVQSGETPRRKALWIALIVFFPGLGLICFLLFGPGRPEF